MKRNPVRVKMKKNRFYHFGFVRRTINHDWMSFAIFFPLSFSASGTVHFFSSSSESSQFTLAILRGRSSHSTPTLMLVSIVFFCHPPLSQLEDFWFSGLVSLNHKKMRNVYQRKSHAFYARHLSVIYRRLFVLYADHMIQIWVFMLSREAYRDDGGFVKPSWLFPFKSFSFSTKRFYVVCQMKGNHHKWRHVIFWRILI